MSVSAFAEDVMGQPTDKAMGWQPAGSALKRQTEWFYNDLLFPIIVAICLLVAGLLLWIMVRYNKKANPVPAKFSHNTLIEIIWTVIPVLILVVIAIYSLSLLRDYNDMPKPDVVVKATGNQWFWTYDYPELGVTDIESRLREDAKDIKTAKAAGIPYLLEVDNVLVVPVNKVIHVQTTGADVIHSFTVPAFGFKIDAIPGRLNNTWFKAEKIGTYYGQCSELCGKDHAYMPIEVKVVSDADFDAFIIKNGGKTRAMIASEAAASAAAAEEAAASAATAASASAEAAASAAPASAAATPANASASAAPASGAAAAH
ncbi:cytochrome c oxidase subunit II [Asticcacaulis sp.]|uniref:cytochrome c oxidase subunit II n=1 Tax=Asticcacaulis sp. TaxID=1872648 RepID=UPI003F7CB20C